MPDDSRDAPDARDGRDGRDLARYLPLSQRPRVDESAVNGEWDGRLDELERAVAALGTAASESPASAALDPSRLAAFEGAVASARRRRRMRVGDLALALVAAYELAGERLVVDPTISGAVCLARALAAPLPIRAVIRDRTLRATDAGWTLGRGADLAGTARELTLFLYGRAGLPGS